MTSREDIASAVSGHRFAEALPHLHEGIVWDLVGAERIVGREAVEATLRSTDEETAGTRTAFSRFRVLSAGDSVVIDSLAEYTGPDGTSAVASCDVYDFEEDRLVAIRSYAVEV